MNIDLNCDLGEGCSHDDELLELVTTANVCCGSHAGDAYTSFQTVQKAAQRGVRIGAHPGYADREHFGRRELSLSYSEIYAQVASQVNGLKILAASVGQQLSHIKPHGALYNQACRDRDIAFPLLAAICWFDVPVMALPNSMIEKSFMREAIIREGFADRRYQPDGSLIPRDQPSAFVEDPEEAVNQAERLVREQGVQSICVHGDNPRAVEFVKKLRDSLTNRGHRIVPFA